MNAFEFYCPTRVIFGTGAQERAGEYLAASGRKKVLLHYGGGSAVRSGLLGRVEENLRKRGIEYVKLGGVKPNPELPLVREGIEICIKEGVDFILAVGGGSVIDSAKAIAIGARNPDTDIWDYFLKKAQKVEGHIPVGCILTMAAAGSETSNSCVIMDPETRLKRSFNGDFDRAEVAFMDPELLATVPKQQKAYAVTDIMMHTLDRYFAADTDNALTDAIAEGLLRTVILYGRRYVEDSKDRKAASEIMWCGSISHNQLTGLGNSPDFAVHNIGHELSAMFDAPHGATLSAIWRAWAEYVAEEDPGRFAGYASRVWNVPNPEKDLDAAAREGIRLTWEFFRSIGSPISIPELLGRSLTEDEMTEMAEKCTLFGKIQSIGTFKKLEKGDILKIYRESNRQPKQVERN